MEHSTTQIIVSSAIFIVAYILIIWDKFDRAVIAMSGAIPHDTFQNFITGKCI